MVTIRIYRRIASLFAVAGIFFIFACGKESPYVNPNDTINGSQLIPDAFSVSPRKQVYFSQGNLQKMGFAFVSNEWDYGGYFCWGTGNRPTYWSLDDADFSSFYDWGEYVSYSEGGWRTMYAADWVYLLEKRPQAEFKRGTGKVCGIHGLILLPDGWKGVEDIEFSSGCISWDDNVYTRDQWMKMKEAGAVFLPASDMIYEGNICDGHPVDPGPHYGAAGLYWTATPSGEPQKAQCMFFSEGHVHPSTAQRRCFRQSVRLVRDVK